MPQCIIGGCPNPAPHNFGVRLRRPRGSAIWAPNTNAYLCNDHASQGYRITVELAPRTDRIIETYISSPGGHAMSRSTPILHLP